MGFDDLVEGFTVPELYRGCNNFTEAIQEGVEQMSGGRVTAVPMAAPGRDVGEHHERYALHVDEIPVGELLLTGGYVTGEQLYDGVIGVLETQPVNSVAMITPIPKSR